MDEGSVSGDGGHTVNPTEPSGTKVERLLDRYGLDGLGEELERQWVGDRRERQSLRDLADHFNERLLESVIAETDEAVLDGEAGNLYRLLTDEDVPSASRAEAESRLQRLGIDVETLQGRFVSHQAVHTYLTSVRDVSHRQGTASTESPVEKRRQAIQRLRNRLLAVVEHSLQTLVAAGHLQLGSIDVTATVTVYCQDCGVAYELTELLEHCRCDCRHDTG